MHIAYQRRGGGALQQLLFVISVEQMCDFIVHTGELLTHSVITEVSRNRDGTCAVQSMCHREHGRQITVKKR